MTALDTLPPTPADSARILESITDAFFALDADWRFTYVNAQAERLLFRTREELLGCNMWEEFPEAVGSRSHRKYERAVREQITVSFEDYYAPLATWFENSLFPSPNGLFVYFRDINARKQSEETLRLSEERLRDTQARLEASLSAGGIATWSWDLVNERVVADAALARLFSVSPEDAAGGPFDAYLPAIHPDDRAYVLQNIEETLASREVYEVEHRVLLPDGSVRWLAARGRVERDLKGKAVALTGVVADTSEQVERRQREMFLAELAERARRLTDPEEVIADALRSLGEFLGVTRCVFVDIDIEADTCTCRPDYCADSSVASIAGVFPISAFGAFLIAEYQAGRAVVVDDVRDDTLRVPVENIGAYDAVGVRAHVSVPVVHSSRLVSCIGVHSAAPRHWKSGEIELIQRVIERTWLTVEVTRRERAFALEAAATTRILESITDAFFALDRDWRFTHINSQAEEVWGRTRTELLGRNVWDEFPEAIGSTFDQQFRQAVIESVTVAFKEFYPPLNAWLEVRVYPSADGLSVFFQDVTTRKHAEDEKNRLADANRLLLESTGDGIFGTDSRGSITFVNRAGAEILGYMPEEMLGRNSHALTHHTHPDGSPYPRADCPIYQTMQTQQSCHIESDVFWCKDGTSVPVAYSAAPILENGAVRGVVVTYSDISERKALEQAQTALLERERNIATQLQEALQPKMPNAVPGLALAKHYEAALAQSEGVGGDFYDVFAIKPDCTALVVGDLSGKGLAAATQVATVRNMLRYALYRARSLASAIIGLNVLLAEQGLLTGFATLFVGAYDRSTGILTYVNCGQEPALVRRAASSVIEPLLPTGPVLGANETASFEQQTVPLSPGDAVIIFTDGATECGPNRREMLGIAGVTALMEMPFPSEEADSAEQLAAAVASRLVAGVNGASEGGVAKDDLCILVAVVEGAASE